MHLKLLTDTEYVFIRLQADFELFFFTVSKTGNFRQQFIKKKKKIPSPSVSSCTYGEKSESTADMSLPGSLPVEEGNVQEVFAILHVDPCHLNVHCVQLARLVQKHLRNDQTAQ